MLRHKQTLSILALVAPFVFAAAATTSLARATYEAPNLCIAAGIDTLGDGNGACEYAAWDAPVFKDEVCWNGEYAVVRGDAPCPPGSKVYTLTHGEVISVDTGEVAAYAALPNACNYVPCAPTYQNNPFEDGVACCSPGGDCTPPDANGMCPMGDVTWCKEIEENQDGTITCHE